MRKLLAFVFCLLALAGTAGAQTPPGAALSPGYLSIQGNQFIDSSGNKMRIASTSYRGTPTDQASMNAIRQAGFNAIRIDWRDAYLSGGSGESAPGTTVTTVGPSINASRNPGSPGSGNLITITSGGQVAVNTGSGPVTIGNTANVIKLYYNADTAYQQNNALNWFGPILAGAGGSQVADPTTAPLSGFTPPVGCNTLTQMDQCVALAAAATPQPLKVIFSHRGNEIPSSPSNACNARQANGLWFDSGGSSGNDDGCSDGGNVTYAQFKANTATLMQRYAGNSTVIGYDFHAEPLVNGAFTGIGTGVFSVNGNSQIIGPNGQPFRATGVDTFAQSLGSIMRLTNGTSTDPLTTVWFPNINMFRIYTSGDSVTSIAPYINALTAQHIVTVIHDTSYIGTCPSGTATTGAEGALISQFLGYANAYKNNPYVWLGSLNEPGGPRSCNNQVMIDFYNSMRCLDATKTVQGGCPIQYNNILEIEGAESSGIDGSLFSFMKNIYIDAHMYGPNVGDGGFPGCSSTSTNLTCFQEAYTRNWTVQTWGIVDADGGSHPPVIVGEFGDSQNGQTIDSNGPQWAAYVANTNPPNGPTEQFGYGAWGIYTFGGESDALIEPNSGAAGSNGTLQSPTGLAIQADVAAGPGVSVGGGGGAAGPNPPVNWNGGGDTDILAACNDVGAAVFAVNPGVIQFCEGPLNNGANNLLSGAAKP